VASRDRAEREKRFREDLRRAGATEEQWKQWQRERANRR
jgi:hypothetical protein